jgi:hypothetical protein
VPQDEQKECGFDKPATIREFEKKKMLKHPTLRKGREGWGTRRLAIGLLAMPRVAPPVDSWA